MAVEKVPNKRLSATIKGKIVGIEETAKGTPFIVLYQKGGDTVKVYLNKETKIKKYQDLMASGQEVKMDVQIASLSFFVNEDTSADAPVSKAV